jgi:UDP-N-acetylmuramyl pentapeptide synthase
MIKGIAKSSIGFVLKWSAKAVLWRYKPFVIAIVGSEGKSEIREKISLAIKKRGDVKCRENSRGYNTVFSLPLSILDEPTGKSDPKLWWKIVVSSLRKAILGMPFPEVLVLEFGVDTKGEMEKLLRIVRPDLGILLWIRPRGFGDEQFCHTLKREFSLFAHQSYKFIANADDENILESVSHILKKNGKSFSLVRSDASFYAQNYNSKEECTLLSNKNGEKRTLPKKISEEEIVRELVAFGTEIFFHDIHQTLKYAKEKS